MPEDRKCTECGCDIKLNSKTGVCSKCYPKWYKKQHREQERENNVKWYAENREQKLEEAKKRYDPDKKKKWRKKYYEDNKAREIERSNEWRAKFKAEKPEEAQKQSKASNDRRSARGYHRDYYSQNIEARRAYAKQWRDANKDRIQAKHRERYKTDVQYRLRCILRVRFNEAMGRNKKSGSAVRDLGCTIAELKVYLESMFYPEPITGVPMTWDNWGLNEGTWQIDHIAPLMDFDLTDPGQLKLACNYKNLRPLWHCDHLLKSNEERKRGMVLTD